MQFCVGGSSGERRQLQAIAILTARSAHLMAFLSETGPARLNGPPAELVSTARGMSSTDFILTKLAVDIWCQQDQIAVHELSRLDVDNFSQAVKALGHLASGF